jgi:predicted transcriptional regulator
MTDKTSGNHSGRWSKVAARAVVDRSLTATDVRVLAVIGIYADHEGIAWPSQETIAMAIGINRETVCKAIKRLRGGGYLYRYRKRTPRGWFRNVYRLSYPEYVPFPARIDVEEWDRTITSNVPA